MRHVSLLLLLYVSAPVGAGLRGSQGGANTPRHGESEGPQPQGAMMMDAATPFAVIWGLGSPGWYADPLEGGQPGGAGLSYDVAKFRITAYNHSAAGSAGGMAFAIDPGSFPQLGNPICEPLGTDPPNPACHNGKGRKQSPPPLVF